MSEITKKTPHQKGENWGKIKVRIRTTPHGAESMVFWEWSRKIIIRQRKGEREVETIKGRLKTQA